MADDERARAGFFLLHDDKLDDPWEDLAWLRDDRYRNAANRGPEALPVAFQAPER